MEKEFDRPDGSRLKSVVTGALSGVATGYVALHAIATAAAIAAPRGTSSILVSVMVFGLGAFLPALIIQFTAVRMVRADALTALVGFCVASTCTVAVLAGLDYTGTAIIVLVVGAIAETLFARLLRPAGIGTR